MNVHCKIIKIIYIYLIIEQGDNVKSIGNLIMANKLKLVGTHWKQHKFNTVLNSDHISKCNTTIHNNI